MDTNTNTNRTADAVSPPLFSDESERIRMHCERVDKELGMLNSGLFMLRLGVLKAKKAYDSKAITDEGRHQKTQDHMVLFDRLGSTFLKIKMPDFVNYLSDLWGSCYRMGYGSTVETVPAMPVKLEALIEKTAAQGWKAAEQAADAFKRNDCRLSDDWHDMADGLLPLIDDAGGGIMEANHYIGVLVKQLVPIISLAWKSGLADRTEALEDARLQRGLPS